MKKHQLLALAAFFTSLANDGEGAPATTTEPAPEGAAPPAKRRGRPPGTATPPPEAEPPLTPEPTKEPEAPPAAAEGKTYDDMQKVIEPLVKGYWNGEKEQKDWAPRGPEVKAVILKYGPTLRQMDPKHYPAFQADIEALLM